MGQSNLTSKPSSRMKEVGVPSIDRSLARGPGNAILINESVSHTPLSKLEDVEPKYNIEDIEESYKGKSIVILDNGRTGESFEWQERHTNAHFWSIDFSFVQHKFAEVCFIMDDIEGPAFDAYRNKPFIEKTLRNADLPIITTHRPSDFEALVEYPLKEIQEEYGLGYFCNSLSYALAYAIKIGVSSIELHGADYYTEDERDIRACISFWIGVAHAKGINVSINIQSRLLQMNRLDFVNRHVPGYYGYVPNRFPAKLPERSFGTQDNVKIRPDDSVLPDQERMVSR